LFSDHHCIVYVDRWSSSHLLYIENTKYINIPDLRCSRHLKHGDKSTPTLATFIKQIPPAIPQACQDVMAKNEYRSNQVLGRSTSSFGIPVIPVALAGVAASKPQGWDELDSSRGKLNKCIRAKGHKGNSNKFQQHQRLKL